MDYSDQKQRIQSAVLDYIEDARKIVERHDLEPPRETLYDIDDGVPSGFNIRVPSQLMPIIDQDYTDQQLRNKHFQTLSSWLVENGREFPQSSTSDSKSKQERIEACIRVLQQFAHSVMDYESGLSYRERTKRRPPASKPLSGFSPSQQAFDKAFEVEIQEKAEPIRNYKVVVVLNSFSSADSKIRIPYPVQSWEDRAYEVTLESEVELCEVNTSEKAGIATRVNERYSRLTQDDYPTQAGHDHKIGFEVSINDRSSDYTQELFVDIPTFQGAEELAENVVTGLRLFKPGNWMNSSAVYVLGKNWHSETLNINRVVCSRILSHRNKPVAPFSLLTIHEHEQNLFSAFWTNHKEIFCGSSHSFSKGLRGFNQSYDESTLEDQIVDYFIAFESTLLKDKSSQYKTRFPARILILLAETSYYSLEYLEELAINLYEMRNKIVHSDQEISNVIDSLADKGKNGTNDWEW